MGDAKNMACIMAIFGGTGDLTGRKLIPAICKLAQGGSLPGRFALVGIGRRPKSHEQYREELITSIKKISHIKIKESLWSELSKRILYYQLDFSDPSAYEGLRLFLDDMDKMYDTCGNRLYYLAVAPVYFETIALNLKENGMAVNKGTWQRLMIEKPFGRDLATARYLNDILAEVFPEENIFRIDHYLGKEMLQNMLVLRFSNAMFESTWNNRYIDNIQITSGETVGVESRAGYYETSGAMRDMVQNHMLQLLALTAMEPPGGINANSIKDEKVRLLRSLSVMSVADVRDSIVRGQYGSGFKNNETLAGYREENGVSNMSDTETYVAMRLFINNSRWANVPFYLRTGKRLPEKAISVIVEFKSVPGLLNLKEYSGMQPNILEIQIEPKEGITFHINSKKPGMGNDTTTVKMDFCQNCSYAGNSPEAYERLIADVLRNDHTLFTSWDEIEASWSFTDNIIDIWKNTARPAFPNYSAGTWGPAEADELLAKSGHKWRYL